MNTTQGHNGHEPGKTPGKAALASWIGSVLEYYDFFIYGTAAALVFGKVFFPESDPATATLLSFATYGVGYVARPIGAFFMGHIGDKYGRKRVLVLTVSLMGTATFLVGCLPSYDAIGIWAPILLVCLRLLQGFSASGEQSGANSLSLEHAPEHRRGYFTSFTLSGTQTGLIIATAIFLPIGAMPEDQLLSWGWRIPFWLSAIVVAAALVIRRRRSARRPRPRPRPSRPPRSSATTGPPCCASRWPPSPRRSAPSSPSTRSTSRSTPRASTRPRCCGSRS